MVHGQSKFKRICVLLTHMGKGTTVEREKGPVLAGGWDCVKAGCEEASGG